jgi:hypothetical protein
MLTRKERQEAEDLIAHNPKAHPVVPGTSGIRKARAARGGGGKRGGVRIIYYFWTSEETIYFLIAYPKSRKDDLDEREKKSLKELVKTLKEET